MKFYYNIFLSVQVAFRDSSPPCRITAAGQHPWPVEIVYQGIISADIGTPEIVAAAPVRLAVFTGKDKIMIFVVNPQKDKVKKPGGPFDGEISK